jgi:hypothetical protein
VKTRALGPVSSVLAAAVTAFVLGLATRILVVHSYPANFSFDSYQRWAGREHVLVQDWLPGAQVLLHLLHRADFSLVESRLAFSVVGALAAAMVPLVASALAATETERRRAAWAGALAACFGPFMAWTTTFYHEGLYALVVLGALALAFRGRLAAADVLVGAAGLVRYEGWLVVLAYLAWRRSPRALVALWGPATWLVVRAVHGPQGFAASPVDFADWNGAWARFEWLRFVESLNQDLVRARISGGLACWALAAFAAWRARGDGRARLVTAAWLGQLAFTAAWIAAIGSATSRMNALPVILAWPLAALAAAQIVSRLEHPGAYALTAVLAIRAGAEMAGDAFERARSETVKRTGESRLAAFLDGRPGSKAWVEPAMSLGTRHRHDGCEAILGNLGSVHGERMWCAAWVPPPDAAALYAETDMLIRWSPGAGRYLVTRHARGSVLDRELPVRPPMRGEGAEE